MRFSLISLITVISAAGWLLALVQTPFYYRATFVAVSLLVIVGSMLLIIMLSPKNENGQLEVEKNFLFHSLEPTFRTVGFISVCCIVVLIVASLVAALFAFVHLLT